VYAAGGICVDGRSFAGWQVIDCRRILKWTYAYGFYSFGNESSSTAIPLSKEQQGFFEFSQVCSPPLMHGRLPFSLDLGFWTPRARLHLMLLPEPTACADCPSSALQGQAESYLEKLHKMVEQDLNDLLDGSRPPGDWPAFRETLIGLTDVTQVSKKAAHL
jgi:hypothetical protein